MEGPGVVKGTSDIHKVSYLFDQVIRFWWCNITMLTAKLIGNPAITQQIVSVF